MIEIFHCTDVMIIILQQCCMMVLVKQLNSVFGIINIPGIHNKSLKERKREAGSALCSEAANSCKRSFDDEVTATVHKKR